MNDADRDVAPAALRLRAAMPTDVAMSVEDLGHQNMRAVVTRFGRAEAPIALEPAGGEVLEAAAILALAERLPLVVFVASTGAAGDAQLDALHGFGRAARAIVRCSGIVPVIMCANGPAVSSLALLLGLAVFVVATSNAYAFVSGPQMVERFTGEPTTAPTLGGAAVHTGTSGVAGFRVDDEAEATELIGELLSLLPPHTDAPPPRWPCDDPVDRRTAVASGAVPATATGSYDVRAVLRDVVDDGFLIEPRADWAPNLVTAFATIDGQPVGLIANQPQSLAGTLDIPCSQKGGRFVTFCDAFNLPLVTFVDTPGFYPGKDLEWRGMIRHGAQLAFAYARATVPRVCITMRKSYGGAYIVMDSKYMGNDLSFAWPSAEIAVMGAKGAVEILHRKADDDERAALIDDYEERLLNPYRAADRGSIDGVIDPADTRAVVADALALLGSKRERLQPKRHDNTPL